jgi:hypothetical protein
MGEQTMTRSITGMTTALVFASAVACASDKSTSPNEVSIPLFERSAAANIDNAFMAHIHLAPVGVNGAIVEWLFPSTAPAPGPTGAGRLDGVLASGTFTAANLVGPLANHPLSDLIAAMRNGGAYVNIHTDDGIAPPNTGPGDFPGGEIRGQLSAPGKP